MSRLLALGAIACLLGAARPARAQQGVDPDRLLGRLRTAYSQPTDFVPAALRFPLRMHVQDELAQARDAFDPKTANFETHWKLARLMEEAGDPGAEQEWRATAELGETEFKAHPTDMVVLERLVEAMVGGDISLRVVTYAEKLVSAQPRSWRAQLLAGDAYLRRADYTWRVLVRLSQGKKTMGSTQEAQLNADLAACEQAYGKAVELAPAEGAPRAGHIALLLARPMMASFLPAGTLKTSLKPDLAAIRKDLLDLVTRNPGQVSALWFAADFLATQATDASPLMDEARQLLEGSAAKAEAKGDDRAFLAEAKGLLACLNKDWNAARTQFEAALAILPDRNFAADWLGSVETNSPDPIERKLERARARLAAHPRAADHVLVALFIADDDAPAAIAELRKALELNVENANVRHNLGILLLRRNPNSIEARHHLLEALELEPDHREAAYAVATAQALGGDNAAARQVFETILKLEDLDANLKARCEATLKELPAPPPSEEVLPKPNPNPPKGK